MEQNNENNASNKSIYMYIRDSLDQGRLPDDFRIPWINDMFAPGSKDGIALYHLHPLAKQITPQDKEQILNAMLAVANKSNADVDQSVFFGIFDKLETQRSIVTYYNDIVRVIAGNQDKLNLEALVKFGDYLISYGISLLSVKVGLNILAGFHVPFVEEICMEFGPYDEFTYYAARILSNGLWQDGNNKLFQIGQNVSGWGRIHAVAYLKPETKEIKDWLLYDGANNTIHPQYSVSTCLIKAGAVERLVPSISKKEFDAIGRLIETALRPDGPMPGIPNAEELIWQYLTIASNAGIEKGTIQAIIAAADNLELSKKTTELAKSLLAGV